MEARRDERAILSAYVQARIADDAGASDRAAKSYAAILAVAPENEVLAGRALLQALAAGNRGIAVRSARILESAGSLSVDARLVLLSEALKSKKWDAAQAQAEAIGKDNIFGFMAPVLRAWIAQGSKRGEPLAILDEAKADPLAASYASEHRPFLLLAMGREEEGAYQVLKTLRGAGPRGDRLKIAAAATLAKKGNRKRALSLLQGEGAPLAAARSLVERRKSVPGGIVDARTGIAELLVRIALDLQRQEVAPLALAYARLATFMAPENSETWLVTSGFLAARNQPRDALAVLDNVEADDPYAATASDNRIKLLVANGDKEKALAQAEAAVKAPKASLPEWTRLGDLYMELDRLNEAAIAYDRALALLPASGADPNAAWGLYLLRGSALEQAERWPEARAALQQAYKLAPEQAIVLNYLGYAQLERRENIEEAMKLIAEASRLQPDSHEITDSLGWAHYLRGNVPKAIELLERAAQGRPGDSEIHEHLGDAYFAAGRRYEARYAWHSALLFAEKKDEARLKAKIDSGLKPELASP